jgi:hypothetical protein
MLLAWLVVSPGWPADEPFGRLFFSPVQRAQLEEARRRNIRAEEQASETASKPKAPRARHVTVNGLITRSDGTSVIWVNGKPVESQAVGGLRVSPTGSRESVVLRDAEKGSAVRLKVGQRANLLTGAVEESYEARREQAHAEEAARQAARVSPTGTPTQRRPRKRSRPEDDVEVLSSPPEAEPPAADATTEPPAGTTYYVVPRAVTLPAVVPEQATGASQ